MENLFPAFRFHTPSTVSITPWAPPKATRSSRRQRGGDGATPLAKPVVLVRSTSVHHPANNQVVEGPYDPSFNPSPLSLASKRPVETPISRRNRRALHSTTTPKPPLSDALASVGVVFNNQSEDDLEVFCTKLSARRILEFRLEPGATSERHVVGRPTTPNSFQGIQLVYFGLERNMMEPGYRFPIAATDVAVSDATPEGIRMAFASNCIGDEVYELYSVDRLGRATHVAELPRGEPLRVTASPSQPYIVQCMSSQRGVAITVDASVLTSKARYSIVLDDAAHSMSFMAQTLKSTDENIVLMSFLPSRPLDYS
ncbi:hypothetical protein SDRG_10177 [Saprolegnia diclina VS20]|uniref:Uncharacterized protein n=1 Tax=Saprolegnia diclina (strain VS20) TaxID=1156394 RepID=T0RJ93_SAPDV|nr:hypothetical protein SDRG_10177 [Saprolegnia diclina VS20]EQC32438.1 hypothetical protein SDRG_10177 [Saprolegnia diclina VS20]|eukprot:XP_008614379.1 hypothetical protein SDRG_10177 [Saprolegnia diclina VS20]